MKRTYYSSLGQSLVPNSETLVQLHESGGKNQMKGLRSATFPLYVKEEHNLPVYELQSTSIII
jgi:hypothetical protein